MKFVFAIACLTAISILATRHYRRRRKQKEACGNSCYLLLETESKPQNTFKTVLADNSYTPFKHLNRNQSDKENSSFSHPYEEEITALLENPWTEFNFVTGNIDLEMSGSYVWVEMESQLQELIELLSKQRVFAVDTEQHSLRSFLGFTALLQISTDKEDFLVDTIALHDVMGILRPVFANPGICKVFHGADNDVLWLQRDFHIYVVNLFDTAKACEVLSKPQKSLAYLLETYCGVATNKILQREDWRLRPLSEEMIQYARADAHYLLYIADCLITELKKQDTDNNASEKSACPDDKFLSVIGASRRSNMVSLQLYAKEIEASPGYSAALSILSRHLNGNGGVSSNCFESKELVRQLCTWRDLMARMHDESLRFVLSDQAIVAVASKFPKTPTEIYDITFQADLSLDSLSFGSPLPSPSAVVCCHLEDFYYILQDNLAKSDELFIKILQKHLGPNGSCPLSLYNYALLSKTLKPINGLFVKKYGSKTAKRVGRKSSRELFVQKFSCKSPVYHNCRIYARDGQLLCYCDRRKLEWYLRRDLAKLVENDPPAIMLLFDPKGRPEDDDNDFYIQSKKNICVGCGERNHYLRYRIIPSCYRMHFPEHLKSHRSHDIVLLCVDCHEIAHSAAEKYKKQIAAEFGIPLFVRKVVDPRQTQGVSETSGFLENSEEVGVSPLQLRTAAMALLRHGPRMPAKRHEELTLVVKKYFGGREILDKDLERALLVGMSPHERRRFEKKRGLSFKHSTESIPSDKTHENNTNMNGTSSVAETLDVEIISGTQTHKEAQCSKLEDRSLPNEMDDCVKDVALCSGLEENGATSATGSEDLNFDKIRIPKGENIYFLDADDDYESRRLLDETVNSDLPSISHRTASSKYNQKLSLLGHGPHGKQVVDYLLKEQGEDGISQFCQRWRQVFVEAIHPRFLPAGWDIMHSGRREFGEYSVYNPAKKASEHS